MHARLHIEKPLADVPSHCGMVTVLDAHPATLASLEIQTAADKIVAGELPGVSP